MYKISDFSKITNLTVKALRYYDEEGILTPSCRNEDNSYRYYDESEYRKAILIKLLRDLDFSIAEIKDILASCESEADLSYYLEEKKTQVSDRIKKDYELIKKISLHIKPTEEEEKNMDYSVEIKEFSPITVASVRYQGRYDEMGKHIGTIYKAVKGNSGGAPIALYHDDEVKEVADIEVCVPVSKSISSKNIQCKTLPAIKAIITTHKGGYGSINLAYKALIDYANAHKLILKTPSRDTYVKGPGMIFKGNENNYITEVIIPFEEERTI